MRTVRTVFEMGLREYGRTPVLLALLLFAPAYVVGFFSQVLPSTPVALEVASGETVRHSIATLAAVLMTPMVAALVGGVAGLFLMESARDVDGRLAIVGARASTVLVARGAVLTVAAVLASLVAVGVLSLAFVPERVLPFVAATVLVGLSYGVVGALTGLVLNRLAGVYVLLFGPLLDVFLAQNPMAESTPAVAPFLPSHFPMQVLTDAAFTAGVDLSPLVPGLGYLLALAGVAGLAFARRLRSH